MGAAGIDVIETGVLGRQVNLARVRGAKSAGY